MPPQHTKERVEERACKEGVVIPLNLSEFRLLAQEQYGDGSLSLTVMARRDHAPCPHCQHRCDQVHDCRPRVKRDVNLREYQVQLIVLNRRFRCRRCCRTFTEPDSACGRRRRTTARLREAIGKQSLTQTVAQVARSFRIGPRFARECFTNLVGPQLKQRDWKRSRRSLCPPLRSWGLTSLPCAKDTATPPFSVI